jgi:Uma2 family endonuclease
MRQASDLVPASFAALVSRSRYLERPQPLVFPVSEKVPETQLHLDLRTLLYLLLSDYLGETHSVGSDQFVYWDASDPKRCLAPDVYVKCSPSTEPVRAWKVWERGAPDVAVEIISDSDSSVKDWAHKLSQYQALGVNELVRLDLLTREQPELRIWNRVDGVLTERVVEGTTAPSLLLNLYWTLAPVPLPFGSHRMPIALRIAEASDPSKLVPTAREARQAETLARQAAEARIAELEALLKQRG